MDVILITQVQKVFTNYKLYHKSSRDELNNNELEKSSQIERNSLAKSEFNFNYSKIIKNYNWDCEVNLKEFFEYGDCFDDLSTLKTILMLTEQTERNYEKIIEQIDILFYSLLKKQFIRNTKIELFTDTIIKLIDLLN